MAADDGRQGTPLRALLKHEPYRFDVRQAVRLLELIAYRRTMRHQSAQSGTQADILPVGAGNDPRREAVKLRGSLSSRFPPSDIELLTNFPDQDSDAVGIDRPRDRPTLTVTFLGIGGAFGPLPPPLTTRVIERARKRDYAARDFLDAFNHRLLSLLLRQSRLFHPALQIAPAQEMTPAADAPAKLPLLALLGLATMPQDLSSNSGEARLAGIATSLLGAAGLLNQQPVSAHALERLLSAHFGLPVRVIPLCGGWLSLADDQRTVLGRSGRLGRSAVMGGRIWDQAAGIHIEIGPMNIKTLQALLPSGSKHAELALLVNFALGDAIDVEMRLSLLPHEVPPTLVGPPGPRLGRSAWLGSPRLPLSRPAPPHRSPGLRLGWTSWLGQQPRAAPGTVRLRLGAGQPGHR